MPTLRVATVQYDIQWLDKKANFETLVNMIRHFFQNNNPVDLLLLPETFSTGFCIDDKSVQEPEDGGVDLIWLKQMAKEFNCVVAGSVLVKQDDKKVNRFYWVAANGSVEYYDKRH
jgi:predicted amidohydrolase